MQISWWSKLWNWVYWIGKSNDDIKNAQIGIEHTCPNLSSLICWVEDRFEYRGDGFRIHWTQRPITTVHRRKGDCEDFAWLWYDQLTRMGYKPQIWKLYRRKWYTLGIPVWWHTIAYMWEGEQWNSYTWVLTNNKALKLTIKGYFCDKGYCTLRRVDNDIKEK